MNDQIKLSSAMHGLAKAWTALQIHDMLRPIRNEADFERVHALADDLSIPVRSRAPAQSSAANS